MQVCDFTQSYLRWRIDTLKKPVLTVSRPLPMTLNVVRVPLDCRVVVTGEATGRTREVVLGASCQTEQVWVKCDVCHQPNADMRENRLQPASPPLIGRDPTCSSNPTTFRQRICSRSAGSGTAASRRTWKARGS